MRGYKFIFRDQAYNNIYDHAPKLPRNGYIRDSKYVLMVLYKKKWRSVIQAAIIDAAYNVLTFQNV